MPGNGATGIDPTTDVIVRFNKPVQPADVGTFFNPQNFTPALGGVTLGVTTGAVSYNVTYYADPLSFGDLCNFRIRPSYTLPGNTTVTVSAQNVIRGLGLSPLGTPLSTQFQTGAGPGIVNAPVAPEAIYIGIGGAEPGVSVLDLNGFGQGTGDPAISNFERNPNLGKINVQPPLAPSSDPLAAGGAGSLTLTQDSAGNTRLLRDPLVGEVTDIHIGAPLDLVFNNENINFNASAANQVNALVPTRASGNCITTPPHPNPPRLRFPPPNQIVRFLVKSPL